MKIPNQRMGESKKEKKENSQSKNGRKQKKGEERKFLIKDQKKIEEMCRKVFGPDNIRTIQNCHQMNKKNLNQSMHQSPFFFPFHPPKKWLHTRKKEPKANENSRKKHK